MDMLDKRLNDKGKNWRHVLKSLKVLDYCLHEGSELVVNWARKNVYIIKTLREFQHIDEDGRDVGQNSRSRETRGSNVRDIGSPRGPPSHTPLPLLPHLHNHTSSFLAKSPSVRGVRCVWLTMSFSCSSSFCQGAYRTHLG